MTIIYVDHVGGNDETGNGTKAFPYKTIEKGIIGLVGGDEIRCKQTTQVDLNGTLTFTRNSTTVNTSQDLTSQIAANDCIRHPADLEAWWPVASVTSNTITLRFPYWGANGSGKTGKRMRPVTITSNPEIFSNTGLGEPGNLLKVIGGWDFNTDTQVGLTALNNLSTASSAYVFQYDNYTTEYVEIGYIDLSYFYCFTGYNYCVNLPSNSIGHHLYWSGGQLCLMGAGEFEQCYCGGTRDVYGNNALGANQEPVPWDDVPHEFTGRYDISLKDIWIYSCGDTGFSPYLVTGVVDNVNFFNSKNCAIDSMYSGNVYYKNCMFDTLRNSGNGLLYMDWMNQKIYFYNCTIKNSIGFGVAYDSYEDSDTSTFINCTFENNALGDFKNWNVDDDGEGSLLPVITIVNADGENLRYYKDMATIHHTATESRSGKCLKFTPNAVYQPLMERVGTHKVQGTDPVTLKIYLKKSADFNGSVQLMAIREGCWTQMPEEVGSLTESYVEKTLVVATEDLVNFETIEFFVLVKKGTVGSVYADDFSGEQ